MPQHTCHSARSSSSGCCVGLLRRPIGRTTVHCTALTENGLTRAPHLRRCVHPQDNGVVSWERFEKYFYALMSDAAGSGSSFLVTPSEAAAAWCARTNQLYPSQSGRRVCPHTGHSEYSHGVLSVRPARVYTPACSELRRRGTSPCRTCATMREGTTSCRSIRRRLCARSRCMLPAALRPSARTHESRASTMDCCTVRGGRCT